MAKMDLLTPNQLTSPVWLADFGSRDHILPAPAKLDTTGFTTTSSVTVTLTSAASAAATSLAVSALAAAVPAGTVLFFDASNAYAVTTANAAAAATSISVQALAAPIINGDYAIYGAGYGRKWVPGGTLVGRTYAERTANTGFGPADVSTPDDEIFLTLFDVADATMNNDVELVRHGTVVRENFLPNWASLGATAQAAIRARYRCITGQP